MVIVTSIVLSTTAVLAAVYSSLPELSTFEARTGLVIAVVCASLAAMHLGLWLKQLSSELAYHRWVNQPGE